MTWRNFTTILLSLLMWVIILSIWSMFAHGDNVNMDIIKQIESGGNCKAYNKHSGAIGLYQITPVCLADYNKFHAVKFKVKELYNPTINTIIAKWYITERIPYLLSYYNRKVTVNNIIWSYNAGIGNCVKGRLPKETRLYIQKYHKLEGTI